MKKQKRVIDFLKNLRNTITAKFESLEETTKFERKIWPYEKGQGGGEISILKAPIFEKAAVNWSAISGKNFPLQVEETAFFATGISLITHMSNPHAPTVHMNIRYIETEERSWFGGGYDLTPMGFIYEEDTKHFHVTAKLSLDNFGENLYEEYSSNARKYFYIPHRNKERGVGGIFFDHLNSGDFERDFALCRSIGDNFLTAICPIYERRMQQSFTAEERSIQLKMRGHYVEFNLLYDRGTQFGFKSGGNPEAILCSMPPLVVW